MNTARAWLLANYKPILTALASLGLAYELHAGKITPDTAIMIGSALAAIGLHVTPFSYKLPAPSEEDTKP